MKKLLSLLMALAICMSLSTGVLAKEEAKIVIEYPANLQEKGFVEPVILDKMPERVVCLSSTPVLTLYEMGVKMVGIPTTRIVEWPKDLQDNAQSFKMAHNSNFDIETVIAIEPDLVLMGYYGKDTYGKILDDAKVPIYYVDAGHTVPYDSIRAQTVCLIDAFGKDSQAGKDIMSRFETLEARMAEEAKKNADKTVMVLQSAPPAHYIQTSGGTLGSMADMLGFQNVYTNDASSMAPIDLETALNYDPTLVLAVGGTLKAEEHQKAMEEDFAKNPDYWNSIPAIKEGRILYLPIQYVASAGIKVIDNINELIDSVNALLEK